MPHPLGKKPVDRLPIEREYYAQMMIDITADGPLDRFCPELARLLVEEVIVGKEWLFVRFKDGSE